MARLNISFFAGSKGTETLPLLRSELGQNSSTVRFQFNESPITMIDTSLPSTEEIISQLGDGTVILASSGHQIAPSPEAVRHPAAVFDQQSMSSSNNNTLLTDPIKTKIESIVIDLVGPMGSIICTEAIKSANSLETALTVIAANLADLNMEQTFMDRIQASSLIDEA